MGAVDLKAFSGEEKNPALEAAVREIRIAARYPAIAQFLNIVQGGADRTLTIQASGGKAVTILIFTL